MSKLWEELSESGVIDEKIQEALEQKLAETKEEARSEARQELEESVRSELSARFEKDKGELVTAMDKFLSEAVSNELNEFQEDRREVKAQKVRLENAIKEARADYTTKTQSHMDLLKEFMMRQLKEELTEFAGDRNAVAKQRVKLSRAILEARRTYETKLQEHIELMKKFLMTQLHEEISEFQIDKKELEEQKRETAKKLREHRVSLQEQFANRTSTLEKFVLKQLRKELTEFNEDKKALVEQRVKLASESKTQIEEAKSRFVKRASELVESTLEDQIRTEMVQFKDDIKAARQNHFGRKIFEAFSEEFKSSYLSEGTEVRKVETKMAEVTKKLEDTETKLTESRKSKEASERKLVIAEEKAQRTRILTDLLTPLKRDKKSIMSELLENVKTNGLKKAYSKYLPAVLNEGGAKKAQPSKLTEGRGRKAQKKVTSRIVEATGNRVNRLTESAEAENNQTDQPDPELTEFLALAGVNN